MFPVLLKMFNIIFGFGKINKMNGGGGLKNDHDMSKTILSALIN